MAYEYRNAQYLEDGRIDCEIFHPQRNRWMPYTADPNDDDDIGGIMHALIVEEGTAAPYIPPPEPPNPPA